MESSPDIETRGFKFRNDPDRASVLRVPHAHEGKGTIDVKLFFQEESASKPALLLIYTIPPGASEGVHTHNIGDPKMGSFDEFYYIISGRGEMQIDGKKLLVSAGDHIFTPNGAAHGIENTAHEGDLKVYLVAVTRE
jgi:mannose-6-phosphate isomerase-like protein (cupin superfamily)